MLHKPTTQDVIIEKLNNLKKSLSQFFMILLHDRREIHLVCFYLFSVYLNQFSRHRGNHTTTWSLITITTRIRKYSARSMKSLFATWTIVSWLIIYLMQRLRVWWLSLCIVITSWHLIKIPSDRNVFRNDNWILVMPRAKR